MVITARPSTEEVAELTAGESRRIRVISLAIFVFACGWYSYGITAASLWQDEAVTATMVSGSPIAIVDVAHQIFDRVHLVYYEILWVWVQLFGTSESSLRGPSVLAMAIAAVVVFAIARRYVPLVGAVSASLVFVFLPATTRYAHEARSSALIVAGVAVATWLMLRAVEGRGTWNWVAYSAVMSGLCFLNLLVPLALIPHAAFMFRRVSRRLAALVWTPVLGCSMFVALLSIHQRGQIGWIPGASVNQLLLGFAELAEGEVLAWFLGLGVLALAVLAQRERRWSEVGWILAGCAVPVALLAVSVVKPLFVPRYVVFVLVFVALAVAIAAARTHAWMPVVLVVAVLILGLPAQASLRTAAGHDQDFRGATAFLETQAGPDDAVVYRTPTERMGVRYYAEGGLPLADPFAAPLRFELLPNNAPCRAEGISRFSRIWVISLSRDYTDECLSTRNLVSTKRFGGVNVLRYE